MSSSDGNKSVPPLYNKHQPLSRDWLYKKPPLKVRTQERFDASQYLKKAEPLRDTKPGGRFFTWAIGKYNKDPIKFVTTVFVGGCAFIWTPLLYPLVFKPIVSLAYHAKDAMFPTLMVPVDDEEEGQQ